MSDTHDEFNKITKHQIKCLVTLHILVYVYEVKILLRINYVSRMNDLKKIK